MRICAHCTFDHDHCICTEESREAKSKKFWEDMRNGNLSEEDKLSLSHIGYMFQSIIRKENEK